MKRHQDGIALVTVIWVVSLLSVTAASLAQNSSLSVRRIRNSVLQAQARAALGEALTRTIIGLTSTDPTRHWLNNGQKYRISMPAGMAEIRIFDAAGRVDLNKSPGKLLRPIVLQASMDEALAEQVMQAIAARTSKGAWRPFGSVGELASLPGMTPAAFTRLNQVMTVYNPSGRLNWRKASATVIRSIPGLSEPQQARLLAMRTTAEPVPDPTISQILDAAGIPSTNRSGKDDFPAVAVLDIQVNLISGGTDSAEIELQLPSERDANFYIREWREPILDGDAWASGGP